MNLRRFFLLIFLSIFVSLSASDWPIFKGNLYFTGNNDEIIVKNSNLKWLFQAEDRVFNPIVSDGKVYFLDYKGNLYCVEMEHGRLVWKINIRSISVRFKQLSRSAGKVKYPLIKGNFLFLSDPIAIYALNKHTGRVVWARTGMRPIVKSNSRFTRYSCPMVDSIYSDPILHRNQIIYGTRKNFMSREMSNGHLRWINENVKSFSGFPLFYDDYIFAQSMDYAKGKYTILCLKSSDGTVIWSKQLERPLKIFPPVIYKKNVYIPVNKSIICLNLKNGELNWKRSYSDYITSIPGFTDRAIVVSMQNSFISIIDPANGAIKKRIELKKKSAPKFVTIRDQIYLAYNFYKSFKNRKVPYGKVKAVNFTDKKVLWEYKTPFPGAVSQPCAAGGILFLPAGNYLYAVGTDYYSRVIDGGDGFAVVPGKKSTDKSGRDVIPDNRKNFNKEKSNIALRKLKISIKGKNGRKISAVIEIKKIHKGKVIYKKKVRVDRDGNIFIPKGGETDLIIMNKDYIPKKVIIKDENSKDITLDKFEKGKSFVVDNILFSSGKAYLKKRSIDILDKLVYFMKRNPKLEFKVIGHTDNTGGKKRNQKLSVRRADSVVNYLIKNGISPVRLRSTGHGEMKPIASNRTRRGRQKNRRTEFYILK